ncbi:MAG: hypothetical protein ACRDZP_07235 [Acidimicrobiales bacterium]
MADERPLHERLLDLAIYVPVGLVVSVLEELPQLSEKGRERVSTQLKVAHMLGKLTIDQASRTAKKVLSEEEKDESKGRPAPSTSAASPRPVRRSAGPRPATGTASKAAPRPARPSRSASSGSDVPRAAVLPIPGYDTLAASQVVQRLGSLRPDELDLVRRYEVATRGRRTILHRVAQLSSPDGLATA